MATPVRVVLAGGFTLVFAFYFLFAAASGAADGDKDALWKPFLPESELSKLVNEEAGILQKELDKPKPDEKRIRAAALLVALAAQDCKDRGEPGQLFMLRAWALNLVKEAGKLESSDAKKLVEQIGNYKKLKTRPSIDAKPFDIKKAVEELGDAMVVFDTPAKGGEGIERELLILGTQKKPFTPAQMSDKVILMAEKAALIAEVARAFDDLGKKHKKDWLQWSDDMRQGALDLATAVKSKNNKSMKTAINKLESACNHCHEKFRDK